MVRAACLGDLRFLVAADGRVDRGAARLCELEEELADAARPGMDEAGQAMAHSEEGMRKGMRGRALKLYCAGDVERQVDGYRGQLLIRHHGQVGITTRSDTRRQ